MSFKKLVDLSLNSVTIQTIIELEKLVKSQSICINVNLIDFWAHN